MNTAFPAGRFVVPIRRRSIICGASKRGAQASHPDCALAVLVDATTGVSLVGRGVSPQSAGILAGRIMLVLLITTSVILAAPFEQIIQYRQPDGTQIELWGRGDEFHAVFETLDGYSVVFNPFTKAYHYAKLSGDGEKFIASVQEVGRGIPAPPGLTRHLRINPDTARRRAAQRRIKWEDEMQVSQRWNALKAAAQQAAGSADANSAMFPPSSTTVGTQVGLCLLIDFDDDPATIPRAELVNFCNGDNYTGYGNNGSVKEYFQDNSNNLLTYTNVVTIYIRIPNSLHPKSYYNNTAQGCGVNGNNLIVDAIGVMKSLTNYTSDILPAFDALTVNAGNSVLACNVLYAGGNGGVWSYGLWPHSWSLVYDGPQELSADGKKIYRYQVTNIGSTLNLGTFCHENGHMLCGFPDIYDYGFDSAGGAGRFCLMCYGSLTHNPVQVSAYLKRAAGWATTPPVRAALDGATRGARVDAKYLQRDATRHSWW